MITKEKRVEQGVDLVALLILTAAEGWVLSVLWHWFATPLGAPRIGVFHAAGLNLLWTLFSMRPRAGQKLPSLEDRGAWVAALVGALLLGWTFHWIAFR